MGLENFEPETFTVKFKAKKQNHEFTVRALHLEDITLLIGKHIADIEAAYELFQQVRERANGKPGQFDTIILTICQDAPGLVAEVISMCAGEAHLVEKYRKIPFSATAVAMAEIARMTLEEEGGLKNLSATLRQILENAVPEKYRGLVKTAMSEEDESQKPSPEHEESLVASIGDFERTATS